MYPNFIITTDWHIREDQPVCRKDNFWKVQWEVIDFIKHLQIKYGCPVLHAGDLFNHWKPSPYLLSETMKHLPNQFYTIYGNHDLPQHSLELQNKSGVYLLQEAGKLTILNGVHWNNTPSIDDAIKDKIMMWHVMTYMGKEPYPDCPDTPARKLLYKYKEYDLIVTGHNHKSFDIKLDGRVLINPGSITRQSVAETHTPVVYLYYSDTNKIETVKLPCKEYDEEITREHIEIKENRNIVMEQFVDNLNTNFQSVVQYEKNLEIFKTKNSDVKQDIYDIIYKSMEV